MSMGRPSSTRPYRHASIENDAVVYFDEVKIPWERVFVHNDVEVAKAQWFEAPVMAYQNYPAQIRLGNKLFFLLGLAYRMAQANGTIKMPGPRKPLGKWQRTSTRSDRWSRPWRSTASVTASIYSEPWNTVQFAGPQPTAVPDFHHSIPGTCRRLGTCAAVLASGPHKPGNV